MAYPNLWGTTDTRNGLPTTTRESPDFSHGECQAESDDDNCTSYYLINKNSKPIYFGYSFTSEGDIIRTDLDF